MKKTRTPRPKWTKTYTNWDEVPVVLDVDGAAIVLHYNEDTVRRLLQSGKLKGTKAGKSWRVDKENIRIFLRGGENQ